MALFDDKHIFLMFSFCLQFFQMCEDIEDEYDKSGETVPGVDNTPKVVKKGKK